VLDKTVKTIIITSDGSKKTNSENILYETITTRNNSIPELCKILHSHDIQSVIIEGGAYTIQSFIDANLWDEARVFTGQNSFKKGVKAPVFKGKLVSEEKIINDTLRIYNND